MGAPFLARSVREKWGFGLPVHAIRKWRPPGRLRLVEDALSLAVRAKQFRCYDPDMSVLEPRYEGKPFLRLLDCYVVWAIDELSDHNAQALKEMTPKLQSIYGVKGEWHEIVRAVTELPPHLPTRIKEMWAKNSEIARAKGVTLTSVQFAEMFVDQNLIR